MFLLILIATGCLPKYVKQVEDPNIPISRPGYSILPPGAGWYYMERSQAGRYSLDFGKKYDSRTHTAVASVTEMHTKTTFKNPEEFLSFMTNSMHMDFDPRRFNSIKEEIVLDDRFGKYSLRFYSEAEDHGASISDGTLPFLTMKLCGYIFVHPWIDNLTVQISYSERGRADEIDPAFNEVGQKIFEGFKIAKEK
jgi:hypothetical protein